MNNLTFTILAVVALAASVLGSAIHPEPANIEKRDVRGGSYVTLGDKEYFISDDADQVTFADAVEKCEALGLALLSIETQEENSRIVQHCAENDCLTKFIWTSAVKNAPRDWTWSSTGEQIDFWDWAYRQPDNNDEQIGMAVYPLEGWNDVVPTDVLTNYICE